MTATLTTAKSSRSLTREPDGDRADYEQLLIDANVNPRTGLATDYLNHFNEAIMLLDMIADLPECADDFMDWCPLSYREHFQASHLQAQSFILQAYEEAEPSHRARFDHVTSLMSSILLAVNDGMRATASDQTRIALARQAVEWVKPLLLVADGLIHDSPIQDSLVQDSLIQDSTATIDVDRIMKK